MFSGVVWAAAQFGRLTKSWWYGPTPMRSFLTLTGDRDLFTFLWCSVAFRCGDYSTSTGTIVFCIGGYSIKSHTIYITKISTSDRGPDWPCTRLNTSSTSAVFWFIGPYLHTQSTCWWTHIMLHSLLHKGTLGSRNSPSMETLVFPQPRIFTNCITATSSATMGKMTCLSTCGSVPTMMDLSRHTRRWEKRERLDTVF